MSYQGSANPQSKNDTKLFSVQCFVLRTTSYLENDLIVSLLTKEGQRLDVFARGAKKSTKRYGAGLDHFQFIQCLIEKTKNGSLFRLIEINLTEDKAQLLNRNMSAFAVFSYIAELLYEFLKEGQQISGLYEIIDRASSYFQEGAHEAEDVLIALEKNILPLLGYWPDWGVCGRCQRKTLESSFYLHPMECVLFCQSCQQASGLGLASFLSVDKLLMQALLSDLALNKSQKRALRHILESLIHHVLGKKLKSHDFLQQLL